MSPRSAAPGGPRPEAERLVPVRPDAEPVPAAVSRFIETDDHALIHVRDAGSGPALVLVHGWSMSGAYFDRQAALARRFRLIRPDLRGHGLSSKVLHGHCIPRYAEDLRQVLDALGVGPCLVAGWSMGGPVALAAWRAWGPGRIRALALVESCFAPLSSEPWNTHFLRGGNLDLLARTLRKVQEQRAEHLELFVQAMYAAGHGPERESRALLQESLRTPAPIAAAIYSDYLLRDYSDVPPTVAVPALAAYGCARTGCYGPAVGRWLAEAMPDCRLALFERSGHLPFLEEAEAFDAELTRLAERAGLRP